jgi:hypothetical protein
MAPRWVPAPKEVVGDAVPQGGDSHVLAPPAAWRASLQACCPVREVTGRSVGPIGPGEHGADGHGHQASP